MIVVSDTSPLTNLAAVEQLELLPQLYGRVLIPAAVYRELGALSAGQPGFVAVDTLTWIEVKAVENDAVVQALRLELGEGEAEAIALALEVSADLLLLDERLGRTVAARFGLKFIGLLGALIEAKQHGLIPVVKPVLDDLIVRAGFWVSQSLYARVLRAAGE